MELQIEEVEEIQELIKNCNSSDIIIIQFQRLHLSNEFCAIEIANKSKKFQTSYDLIKKAFILSMFETKGLFNILFINENEIIYKKKF